MKHTNVHLLPVCLQELLNVLLRNGFYGLLMGGWTTATFTRSLMKSTYARILTKWTKQLTKKVLEILMGEHIKAKFPLK
jgi:hypothetical protein